MRKFKVLMLVFLLFFACVMFGCTGEKLQNDFVEKYSKNDFINSKSEFANTVTYNISENKAINVCIGLSIHDYIRGYFYKEYKDYIAVFDGSLSFTLKSTENVDEYISSHLIYISKEKIIHIK